MLEGCGKSQVQDLPGVDYAETHAIAVWQANIRFLKHGTVDDAGSDSLGAVIGSDAVDKERVGSRLQISLILVSARGDIPRIQSGLPCQTTREL
jgi:hypothetical protein